MTQRERQILRWIEENPMISQQELADRAGITRSSVAVHISNLMKKGYILGKGYVVHTAPYAVVVGGVNLDIGGWSQDPLIPRDSNPGRVRMSLGGVGRNIAHNLCLLGADVRLLTAFGDDMSAQKLAASCGELGIDISQALQVPGAATSTYLFLAGPDGDMALAVNDMDIYRHVTPAYLAARSALLDNAQLILVDTNIPEESIAWLSANAKVPIFADPVSTTKAAKLKRSLGRLHTLKPNRMEAELLSGVPITDEDSLHRCADALLNTGLRRVFISLGGDGIFAADHNGRCQLPCLPGKMVNTTGCGDAAMAAVAWAYLQGTDLEGTAQAALAAGAIAMESAETINPAMSEKALKQRMAEKPV
ncbi:MAG TPA: winged helix-turn-helix transcriptional regulator [Candidatus Enterenecus stercoripullorum]|nr:winged helix-turn-helix transcriptional regulator [Candidatus Enterenecus stercoripullorum]